MITIKKSKKKSKGVRKVRTTNRKSLGNKCEKLCVEIVRIRANWGCEKCGRKGCQLHVHHIIGRTNLHLRYNLKNLICLCAGCHNMTNHSAHKNPLEFMDFLDADRPDWLEYLRKEQNILEPAFDYENKISELQDILSRYKT